MLRQNKLCLTSGSQFILAKRKKKWKKIKEVDGRVRRYINNVSTCQKWKRQREDYREFALPPPHGFKGRVFVCLFFFQQQKSKINETRKRNGPRRLSRALFSTVLIVAWINNETSRFSTRL